MKETDVFRSKNRRIKYIIVGEKQNTFKVNLQIIFFYKIIK